MKTKALLGFATVLFAAAAGLAPAQTLYWDQNGTGAGFQTIASSGTWAVSGGSAFWSTDSTGGSAISSWIDGDSAVFASGTVSVNNTITTAGILNVSGITLQNGRWTFSGTSSTINLGSGGLTWNVLTSTSAGGVTSFASGESFVLTANQTWTNNAANTANQNQVTVAGAVTNLANTNVTLTIGGSFFGQGTTANGSGFAFTGALNNNLSGGTLGITVNSPMQGAPILTLGSTASTYSGETYIQNGTMQIGAVGALGNTSDVKLGDAANPSSLAELSYVSAGSTAATLTKKIVVAGTGSNFVDNNSANVLATLALGTDATSSVAASAASGGSRTLILGGTNTGANAVNSVLADNADGTQLNLQKNDAGTWILNAANTYTGNTTIKGGTLQVAAASTLGASGSFGLIDINGGNLILSADTNIGANQLVELDSGGIGLAANYIPSALPLTLGVNFIDNTGAAGGVLGLSGTGTGGLTTYSLFQQLFGSSSTWSLGSFTSAVYNGPSLPLESGNSYRLGGGGGTIAINNGTTAILVDNGGPANLLVGGAGGGIVDLSNQADTYTGTTTIGNGTLRFTSVNSSTNTGPSSLGQGTSAIAFSSSATATPDLDYAGAGAASTDRGLSFAGGAKSILSNSSTSASSSIAYTAAPTFTGANNILVLGNPGDSRGGSIGGITDGTTGKTNLLRNGGTNSVWTLTGGAANTYTGTTTVNGGVLYLPDLTSLPSASNLTLTGSSTNYAILQSNGTFGRTLGTNFTWTGFAGFAAQGGKLTVSLAGPALVWGSNFSATGGAFLNFGSTTADSQVELTNGFSFGVSTTSGGTTRTIYVEKGTGGDSALLSGAITDAAQDVKASSGAEILVKNGAGTLILSGANTYTGSTTVSAGTLVAGANAVAGITATSAATAGNTTIAVSSTAALGPVGSTGTVAGNGILAGTTYAVASGTSITLGGTGVVTNGAVAIGEGLVFTPTGSSSPIGTAFGDGNTITLGDANTGAGGTPTLLTGGAFTIGKNITLASVTNGGYTIGGNTDNNSSFTGTITANKSFAVTQVATSGSNALTISGGITNVGTGNTVTFNNAGAVIDSGVIGGGAIAVAKTNTGVLTLSGANTYTGATALSGGVTRVGNASAFGTGALTVSGGAQLSASGTSAFTLANATTFSGNVVLGDKVNTGVLTFGTPTVAVSTTLKVLSNVNFSALSLPSTTTLSFDLTNSPLLTLTGTFTASTLAFDFTNFTAGQLYTLASFGSGSGLGTGNFSLTGDLSGYTAAWNLTGTSLGVTLTATPEPATWAMLGLGMAALAFRLRRRSA